MPKALTANEHLALCTAPISHIFDGFFPLSLSPSESNFQPGLTYEILPHTTLLTQFNGYLPSTQRRDNHLDVPSYL